MQINARESTIRYLPRRQNHIADHPAESMTNQPHAESVPRAVGHSHVESALESGTAEAVLMLKSSSTDLDEPATTGTGTPEQAYKAVEDAPSSTTSSSTLVASLWANHSRLIMGAAFFCAMALVVLFSALVRDYLRLLRSRVASR